MEDDDINGLIGDLIRFGTVHSVDLAGGLAVVEAGDVITPALPWTELAGAFRTWSPPSIGEQIILLCPEGDVEGGVIVRGLFSDSFSAPSNTENHSFHGASGLIITLTADGLVVTAPSGVVIEGDVSISGNVAVTGEVTASEDVIGGGISLKDHKHGNVQTGAAKTGAPE